MADLSMDEPDLDVEVSTSDAREPEPLILKDGTIEQQKANTVEADAVPVKSVATATERAASADVGTSTSQDKEWMGQQVLNPRQEPLAMSQQPSQFYSTISPATIMLVCCQKPFIRMEVGAQGQWSLLMLNRPAAPPHVASHADAGALYVYCPWSLHVRND